MLTREIDNTLNISTPSNRKNIEKCLRAFRNTNLTFFWTLWRENFKNFAYSRNGKRSDKPTFLEYSKFKLFAIHQTVSWVHVVPGKKKKRVKISISCKNASSNYGENVENSILEDKIYRDYIFSQFNRWMINFNRDFHPWRNSTKNWKKFENKKITHLPDFGYDTTHVSSFLISKSNISSATLGNKSGNVYPRQFKYPLHNADWKFSRRICSVSSSNLPNWPFLCSIWARKCAISK